MNIKVFKILTIIACGFLLLSDIFIFITIQIPVYNMVIKQDLLSPITSLIGSFLAFTVVTSILLKIGKDRFPWLKIIYNILLIITLLEAGMLIILKIYTCIKHPLNIFLEYINLYIKLNFIGTIFPVLTSIAIIALVVNQYKTISFRYKTIVIFLAIIIGSNVIFSVARNISLMGGFGQMPLRGVVLSGIWSLFSNLCYFTVLCYGFRKNEHPIELEQVVEN